MTTPEHGSGRIDRMTTKCNTITVLFIVLGLAIPSGRAADTPSDSLQKGLIEEEANQNLTGAIQAYQSILKNFEDERKTAAVALFRLGECYKKQGLTNEAFAQFERVVRDFP